MGEVTSFNSWEEDPSIRTGSLIPGTGGGGEDDGGGSDGGGGIGGGGDTGKSVFMYRIHGLTRPEPFVAYPAIADGWAGIDHGGGGNIYAVARDEAGSVADNDTDTISAQFKYGDNPGQNKYDRIRRGVITFPTEGITWSPEKVYVRLNIIAAQRMHLTANFLRISRAQPADPMNIVPSDYALIDHPDGVAPGEIWSGDGPSISTLIPGHSYDFELNTLGLAAFEAKRLLGDPFSVGVIISPGYSGGEAEPYQSGWGANYITKADIASMDHADEVRRPQLILRADV